MDPLYAPIGRRVRARRVQLGLTLEDLAESSGRHPTYIGQIERGGKKASLATLTALAAALDLHIRDLFGPSRTSTAPSTPTQIEALLRTCDAAERRMLLVSLRQLARGLKDLRPGRR